MPDLRALDDVDAKDAAAGCSDDGCSDSVNVKRSVGKVAEGKGGSVCREPVNAASEDGVRKAVDKNHVEKRDAGKRDSAVEIVDEDSVDNKVAGSDRAAATTRSVRRVAQPKVTNQTEESLPARKRKADEVDGTAEGPANAGAEAAGISGAASTHMDDGGQGAEAVRGFELARCIELVLSGDEQQERLRVRSATFQVLIFTHI